MDYASRGGGGRAMPGAHLDSKQRGQDKRLAKKPEQHGCCNMNFSLHHIALEVQLQGVERRIALKGVIRPL